MPRNWLTDKLARSARRVYAVLICALALAGASTAGAQPGVEEAIPGQAAYVAQLEQLAAEVADQSLRQQILAWRPSRDRRSFFIFDPARAVPADALPQIDGAGSQPADAAHRAVCASLATLRRARAAELYQFATAAAQRREFATAFLLVAAALREDPDQADARRVLGYSAQDGQWVTPFSAARHRAGQVWHPRFGWIMQAQVEKYEQGQRWYKSRWIPAEHDARLHAEIDTGWEVETEHFSVATNHSLELAAEVGQRLESLFGAWRQLFPTYTLSESELARLFSGGTRPTRAGTRHQVILYRTGEEFRQALRGEIPPEVPITGVYLSSRKTSYFFAADPPDYSTLCHEAVHQLFSESRTVAPQIGGQFNFWIVEGVACYFESLRPTASGHFLGGIAATRNQDARFRALKDRFYVPLSELCGLGRTALQRDPRIAQLYTQSSGMADFLLHGQQGKYRQSLATYLQAIYSGRDRATSLSEACGVAFRQLDEQYHDYLALDPGELPDAELPPHLSYLLLCSTRITDQSLALLPPPLVCRQLDLSGTGVTDEALKALQNWPALQLLDLSGTRTTAPAIDALLREKPMLQIKR